MKKLVAFFSGLVMTGVGVNHAEASGNTIQTVQQLTQGEKSLENITLGESIKMFQTNMVHRFILKIQATMKVIMSIAQIKVY